MFSMTWLLVMTRPEGSTITPEPSERLRAARGHARAVVAEEAAEELVHRRVAAALLDPRAVDVHDSGSDTPDDGRQGELHLRPALRHNLRLRRRLSRAKGGKRDHEESEGTTTNNHLGSTPRSPSRSQSRLNPLEGKGKTYPRPCRRSPQLRGSIAFDGKIRLTAMRCSSTKREHSMCPTVIPWPCGGAWDLSPPATAKFGGRQRLWVPGRRVARVRCGGRSARPSFRGRAAEPGTYCRQRLQEDSPRVRLCRIVSVYASRARTFGVPRADAHREDTEGPRAAG